MEQELYVISKDVDNIDDLALNVIPVLDRDINIYRTQLSTFTQILMTSRKTWWPRLPKRPERALEMLKGTDMTLGKLRTYVRASSNHQPHSTEVSSMGIHDTSTKKKQISVTARDFCDQVGQSGRSEHKGWQGLRTLPFPRFLRMFTQL